MKAGGFPHWTGATSFLLVALAVGRPAEIPKGRVLEKVACAADATQTYALYIPTTFEPGGKWPVLFCFDPGARGKAPVERFQAAAEKFGWLVAGSNNSRNGPWEANVTAINAMVTDVNRFLPIDSRRIYVAGLSGGARVACQVALGGMPQGVIACSAAFSGGEIPGKLPFAFFGTAGVTDFNYRELRRVDRDLDERRAVHRVVIFNGGHEWLPVELAVDALGWLELHAMRQGTRPKDAAWIQETFAARMAAVPAAPPVERWRALKSVAADYQGLAGTAALEKEAGSLAGSRAVRDALKAERAAERTEDNLQETLLSAAEEGATNSVRKLAAELRAKMTQTDLAPEQRAMAARVVQGVASACGETAREAMRQQEYDTAARMLEAVTLLRPERSQAHFDLARARASLGDRKRALAALQQAIAAGFSDAGRLASDRAFEKLRKDPEFAALLAALQK